MALGLCAVTVTSKRGLKLSKAWMGMDKAGAVAAAKKLKAFEQTVRSAFF